MIKWALNAERVRKLTETLTGARAEAREADCSEVGDDTECNQCKLQEGALLPAVPRRAIRRENRINWEYQLYIANLHAAPERFSYCDKDTGMPMADFDFSIAKQVWNAATGKPQPVPAQLNVTEWLYNGVWFDGFWRDKCTVVDAKGRYAQFLDDQGLPHAGFPAWGVFPDMINEARNQISAVAPARPQASIEWHFLQHEVYEWAKDAIPPEIKCVPSPWQRMVQA
nr:restriction endonuclease fold toxin 5 domain-containing protein [Luteimonas salinisoli]